MAAAAPGGEQDKLETLRYQIETLVISSDAPIKVNSFWNKFANFYQVAFTDLPRQQDYGLTKRSQFLTLSDACVVYTGNDGHAYVKPKPVSQEKRKGAKKKQAQCKEKTSDLELKGSVLKEVKGSELKQSQFLTLSDTCVVDTVDDGHAYVKPKPVRQEKSKEPKKKQARRKVKTNDDLELKEVKGSELKGVKGAVLKEVKDSVSKEGVTENSQSKMAYRNFPTNADGQGSWQGTGQGARRDGAYDDVARNNTDLQNEAALGGVYGQMAFQQQQQVQYQQQQQWQWNMRRQQQQHGYFHQPKHTTREPRNVVTKHVSKDEINVVAEDCIDRLVDAKAYVSPERIEKLLLDHYKVESINNLGVRYLEHIKCIGNLVRAQSRINAYIQAFIRIRAIATLHELQENLREYTEPKNQDFESFRLGPLAKQPLVYDYFKFPSDVEIPEIDTAAILDQLRAYLNENQLWTSKIETEGFMSFLTAQFLVDSPFMLGIRIKSLPLATGVLKKSQRDMSLSSQAAVKAFTASTEETVSTAFRNFSTSMLIEEAGLCQMRKEYVNMSPTRIVEQVFSKLHVLISSLAYLDTGTGTGTKHHKMAGSTHRNAELTKQFSNLLKNNGLYRAAFRLAVCSGWEEVHANLQTLIGYAEGSTGRAAGSEPTVEGSTAVQSKPRPPIGDVVGKVLTYLERCFVHGSLTLAHLARIESKLLEDYNDFPSFSDLTSKSFLDLVTGTDTVKVYLEENGGAVLGSASAGAGHTAGGYHAPLHDLHDFILQVALADSSQLGELERALCWHYHVTEVKQLGHGSIASLHAGATRGQRHARQQHVAFEVALCAKESQSTLGGTTGRQVGLLGHQVRETAIICLHNCPLLADLAEWSHWDLVFKPELGELKDFIRKNGGVQSFTIPGTRKTVITKIVALESRPGVLLKLTSDTSNDMFASSVISGDVSATCGHLASLVAANKGIQNTPVALLGNHLKTGLLKIQSATPNEDNGLSGGGDAGSLAAGRFVLRCLMRLPFVTCQAVASQVFIEPLSDVVGQTRSRELLLSCTDSDSETTLLQALGLLLGIDHWSAAFQQRLQPPAITHKAKVASIAASAAQRESELIEVSSSEEDSDDEGSDFLNTSDESDSEEKKPPAIPDTAEVIDITSQEDEAMTIDSDGDESSVVEVSNDATTDDVSELPVETMEKSDTDPAVLGEEEGMGRPTDPATAACWDIIEDIRRTEFGINVTLSLEGEKLMQKQQARLGRSLDRLSTDLYSKDTHFVLELIQNADDNHYPVDDSIVPSIKFVVEPTCITVFNNETGFQEGNTRAICDVGKSTKGKHKAGYIGQKGIGFKSVFRVTDRPEIHSHHFHFHFDLATGPMGYILPHWAPTGPDHHQSDRWMTKIVLPLKSDVVNSTKLRQLAARFQDVHPSLLLFLHRLRSITVINKIGEYKAKMERRDAGRGIIEIRHMLGADRGTGKADRGTARTDRWLVVKKVLDASHISSQAKSGVEVEATELALAFPLHEVVDMQALAPKQPVFAFLPLRSYGFRFVIQGDFDVPSSREDVDRDSIWNQWLQSEVHTLFVDALQAFKEQRHLSAVEAVCLFVKFIPLEDEILDFFRPVATQILQRLRSEPCLPTDTLPGEETTWRLPSQLVLTTDSLLRDIMTPELLQNQLGLMYLHHEVTARVNPSLLNGLGVQVITTAHLIEIGRALAHLIIQTSADEKAQWMQRLSKWFAAVFRTLDEFNVDKKVLAQIEALPIVPLSNGSVVCLKDNAVFFPLGPEDSNADTDQDMLRYLEKDLNTVDAALFSPLDDVSRPQATRLLELVGVRRLLPSDIIQHHILPALRAPNVLTRPPGLLTAYLVYVKEELDRQPHLVSMADLREVAVVSTNRGLRRVCEHSIHFTPEFGNKLNLPSELPGYDWLLLDPVYLLRSETNVEKRTWHTFLLALGVHDLIAVTEKPVTLSRQDIVQSAWSEDASTLPASEHEFTFTDYECPQFVELVTSNSNPQTFHKQMQTLFDILDSYWQSHFEKLTHAELCTGPTGQQRVLRDIETTFGKTLRQLKWLPALEVRHLVESTGRVVSQRVETEHCGAVLYLPSPTVLRVLATHIPYLHTLTDRAPCSALCNFLRLHSTLTPALVVELLVSWSVRKAIDTPSVFLTSMSHIKVVYSYLQDHLPPKELQDLFHSHPVLFVPLGEESQMAGPQTITAGHMLARSEVRWSDPSGLFPKHADMLEDQHVAGANKANLTCWYRGLEELMLHGARVTPTPTLLEYSDLLIALSNTATVQEALPDILQLFSLFGAEVESQVAAGALDQPLPFEVQQVLSRLKPHAVFPTKNNRWVHLDDNPLIADDKQTERLFAKKDGVHILASDDRFVGLGNRKRARPAGGVPYTQSHVVAFFTACGVSCLSKVLVTKYVTAMFQVCTALHRYVVSVLPFIQKLLCTEFPDVYDAHSDNGIRARLATMKFVQVERLDVVYHLRPLPDVEVVLSEVSKWKDDEDEFTFYVQKDSVTATNELNKELARYFSLGNDAVNKEIKLTLMEVLPLVHNTTPELQDFLRQRDIRDLPEDEEPWELPPLPVVRPPSPPPIPRPPVRPETPANTQGTSTESEFGRTTSWPPMSNQSAQQASGSVRPWPPPAASAWPLPSPTSRPDSAQLPDGLRPTRADLMPPSADTKRANAPTDHDRGPLSGYSGTTGHPGDGGAMPGNRGSVSGGSISGDRGSISGDRGSISGDRGSISGDRGSISGDHDSMGRSISGDSFQHPGHAGAGHMGGGDAYGRRHGNIEGRRPHSPEPPPPGVNTEDMDTEVMTIAAVDSTGSRDDSPEFKAPAPPGSDRPSQKRVRLESGASIGSSPERDHQLWFDVPAWGDRNVDAMLEDVPCTTRLPDDLTLGDGDEEAAVGRWGEHLVYNYLLSQKDDPNSQVLYVKWVNEERESDLPFDCEVHYYDAESQTTRRIYVEVKATRSDRKAFFPISAAEVRCAFERAADYHLYRVFNAGNQRTVRLTRLENLAARIENKHVRLCLVI